MTQTNDELTRIKEMIGAEPCSAFNLTWDNTQIIFQEQSITLFSDFQLRLADRSINRRDISIGDVEKFLIGKEIDDIYLDKERIYLNFTDACLVIDVGRSIDRETLDYFDFKNPSCRIII